MSSRILIRDVQENDAAAIAAIYGHHVINGTASYDEIPPSADDTLAKIRRISSAGWPFMVTEIDGSVVAYAYVTQFRDRAAYRFTAENSIYVHPDYMGRGIGKALLTELMTQSAAFGFRTIIAVIGGAEPGSVALHRSCGFEEAGRLRHVGWKHGRWLDSLYMQLSLVEQ